MAAPKFIDIDGKRFVWRELLQRPREQLAAAVRIEQRVLFELKKDCRPVSERTAAGRYSEPSLFRVQGAGGLMAVTKGLRAWRRGEIAARIQPERQDRLRRAPGPAPKDR